MSVKPSRRFTVSDAMILVAATTPALVVLRDHGMWPDLSDDMRYTDHLANVRFFLLSLSYLISMWSLAFLILQLRRPRPALRRLARQPGMVACTVATVVLAIKLVNHLSLAGVLFIESARRSFWQVFNDPNLYFEDMAMVPSGIGCAVAAAWMVQAIAGRWRPERSWIDRAGRVVGAFWITSIPFSWFSFIISG